MRPGTGLALERLESRKPRGAGVARRSAGRSGFPMNLSVDEDQGAAQEPESPDQPQEPTPGEPGTMPDEPSPRSLFFADAT